MNAGLLSASELRLGIDRILSVSSVVPFIAHRLEMDKETWHRRIIAKWPSAKSSWRVLMANYGQPHQFDQLYQWCVAYIKNFGFDSYMEQLGNGYWLGHDLNKALKIFELGYSLQPHNYLVLKHYGFYLAKANKKKEGIDILLKATQIEPNNFEAFYQLGWTYYEAGYSKEALVTMKKTVELNPGVTDMKSVIEQLSRSPANQ